MKHSGTHLKKKKKADLASSIWLGGKNTSLLHMVVKELGLYKNYFESYYNVSLKSMIPSKRLSSE